MKFINQKTREVYEVSPLELRLSRLKKRLSFFSNWKDEVAEMISEVDSIMVTLTYREVGDWNARHVTEFIRKVKRFLGSRLYGYFWVAEMQERGAVHYHVIFIVPHGVRIPKPDQEGYWEHGMTRIEKVNHVYGYLSKYLSKDGQKAKYPKGIRIFGFSVYVLKDWVAIRKLPQWVQTAVIQLAIEAQDIYQRMMYLWLVGLRKVKGGYLCAGHFIASPYTMVQGGMPRKVHGVGQYNFPEIKRGAVGVLARASMLRKKSAEVREKFVEYGKMVKTLDMVNQAGV